MECDFDEEEGGQESWLPKKPRKPLEFRKRPSEPSILDVFSELRDICKQAGATHANAEESKQENYSKQFT